MGAEDPTSSAPAGGDGAFAGGVVTAREEAAFIGLGTVALVIGCGEIGAQSVYFFSFLAVAPTLVLQWRRRLRKLRATGEGLLVDGKLHPRERFRAARVVHESPTACTVNLEAYRPWHRLEITLPSEIEARRLAASLRFDSPRETYDVPQWRIAYIAAWIPLALLLLARLGYRLATSVVGFVAEMLSAVFGTASDHYLSVARLVVGAPFVLVAVGVLGVLFALVVSRRFDWVVVGRDGIRFRTTAGELGAFGDRFVSFERVRGIKTEGRRLLLTVEGSRPITIHTRGPEQAQEAESVVLRRLSERRAEVVPSVDAIVREGKSVRAWIRSLRASADTEVRHYREGALSPAHLRAIVASPVVARGQRIAAALAFASMNGDVREIVSVAKASGDPALEQDLVRVANGASDDELAEMLAECDEEQDAATATTSNARG